MNLYRYMGACVLLGLLPSGCAESPSPPVVIEPFEVPTEPPLPEPDEPGERFVARWNAWVATLPPESIGRTLVRQSMDEFREIRDAAALGDWDVWTAMDLSRPDYEDWETTVALFEMLGPQFDAIAQGINAEWFD
ncbi:MAG: hypothetical protein AB8F26_09645 [Phycisphaerales bacterium]